MYKKVLSLATLAASCILTIPAQTPGAFTRDYCLKSQPGKGAEYDAMLHDIGAKLARVRIDDGKLAWWLAAKAVVPIGTAARCDYHVVYGYTGFPPEPETAGPSEADFKKAKINMTGAEAMAKRDTLITLVNMDIWEAVAGVGRAEKNNYLQLNMYKTKSGQISDWAKLETEGWKPFVEAWAKEIPGIGWRANALAMPGGLRLHYDAMTVDIFPTWEAVGQRIPLTTLWSKVHADLPFEQYIGQVDKTVDRNSIEMYQVIEVVRGK